MRDEIIKLLDNIGDADKNGKRAIYDVKPLDEIEIHKRLKKKYNIQLSEVCTLLREMEIKGEVYRTNKGEYTLYKFTNLKMGRLSINRKGDGLLYIEGESTIKIDKNDMKDAIHNDEVAVEIVDKNKKYGKVVTVLNRSLDKVVGEYSNSFNGGTILIDDKRVKLNIIIDEKDRNNAMTGHKVLVEPYEKINDNTYRAKVVDIIGHKNDPGVDILSIAYEHDIDNKTPKEVTEELKLIPKEVTKEDIVDRKDLRNEVTVTIDGKDAKDFDDAISIEKLENGNYVLRVHIADVDHYVKEGSAIYKEAFRRATSSYLANTVINMLPELISNGICSLNPNADRLAVTFEMEIDQNGRTVKNNIYKSVINSNKRMTYEDVNRVLNGEIIEDYEPYKEMLNNMRDLSKIIRKSKEQRGAIDFDVPEMLIKVDESGKPIDISIRPRGEGENMIEDFMIKANESGAEYAFNFAIPFIYRTHDKAKEEKLSLYLDILKLVGFNIKADLKRITPKTVQSILKQVDEQVASLKKDENYKKQFKQIICEAGLRSMQKAIFSTDEDTGHYGLASRRYAQCTAPIRRFADLVNQFLLKRIMSGKEITVQELNELKERLIYVAAHCSIKEKNSVDCERAVNSMKAAEFMQEHIGEEHKGIISGMNESGVYVRLENSVDGFVKISNFGEGFYKFDKEKNYFIDRKNKTRKITIGQELNIRVVSASKEDRLIDFEPTKVKKIA